MARKGAPKRVCLAYSGGLDTSVILRWIKEEYGSEVVAFCADVGQEEELSGLPEKARATGAVDGAEAAEGPDRDLSGRVRLVVGDRDPAEQRAVGGLVLRPVLDAAGNGDDVGRDALDLLRDDLVGRQLRERLLGLDIDPQRAAFGHLAADLLQAEPDPTHAGDLFEAAAGPLA